MKKIFLLFLFALFCFSAFAQEKYIVNGEAYELKTGVKGTIDLLWNAINREFRYFVKKDNVIIELLNTKDDNKKFKEEYKDILNTLTKGSNLDPSKVKFTLNSLVEFINGYNATVDLNYISNSNLAILKTRLLVFGGITNSPYIVNPGNAKTPLFGAEIEIFEGNASPRHALFFGLKQVFSSDEFKYSTTQFDFGYRFRFINTEKINVYVNIVFGTYNFSKNTFTYVDQDNEIVNQKNTGNGFDAPFSFGFGADFKVSPNGFITLTYNELFALLLENKGNFSTHIALGYKFNL